MIQLAYLLAATQGSILGEERQTRFQGFSHDARQLLPDEMFVAVRGERGDGHDYIFDAIERGATGLLIEEQRLRELSADKLERLNQITTVVVDDTRQALQAYAHDILQRWQPTIIAVAGGVGKTSTKEAIASILARNYATFRSWKNYNDLLGIPLSLGRLEPHHEYAVLELGCDHPGELQDLCNLIKPQIGVLTNITPVQLQYFGTQARLAEEFGELLYSLPPDGVFWLNDTDERILTLVEDYQRGEHTTRIQPLGLATIDAGKVHVGWEGLAFNIPGDEEADTPITLASRLIGRHHVATMLIAYRVARDCGMSREEVIEAIEHLEPLQGRLLPLAGIYESRLLDDTHNASPASALAGLHTLNELLPEGGKRIAILGEMLNLGIYQDEAYQHVGKLAAQCTDYLILRGESTAMIAEAARRAGMKSEQIELVSTHEDAAQIARQILGREGEAGRNVVLIKGSEATRMERVSERLMAKPEEAQELLIRQTLGWKQIIVLQTERPTWVEIDLSAIGNNVRRIREIVGPQVRILISLKADAYGHGAMKVARTVLHNGASMLGVATLSEAESLRDAGIDAPILIFGYIPYWQMREAVQLGVTLTLYSNESAQALSRAAQALRKSVHVHIKVDTGMGRLGIRSERQEEILALVREARNLEGLVVEGIYTHFASADASDKTYARTQLTRFQQILEALEREGLRPKVVHAANSAATLSLPEAHFDMVRPGIAIYGLDPSEEVRVPEGFRPALSFKTQIAQVKLVPAGECISYGCTYITKQATRVAVLPVGYADGFRRAPRNWETVLVHGQEAPIIGRVCMDQCMIDVSAIPQVRMGDEVVLIGKQGEVQLTAEEVARRLGTINYEVVAEILARVPRVD
ncbi:alanine racemase [Ktedonospora formicarum]|uniref:Multifunctional fusion protein n=1 Tax=Ktedonospora formicarum TaxID=2778364 RepID=A0A8J3HYM4_9CHLR|nr:alanine racemase [Ktedonospora formicarum]GHO43530.1 alanine racemase [Ktedonospora formicarum]